jgi:hypothetical protein
MESEKIAMAVSFQCLLKIRADRIAGIMSGIVSRLGQEEGDVRVLTVQNQKGIDTGVNSLQAIKR